MTVQAKRRLPRLTLPTPQGAFLTESVLPVEASTTCSVASARSTPSTVESSPCVPTSALVTTPPAAAAATNRVAPPPPSSATAASPWPAAAATTTKPAAPSNDRTCVGAGCRSGQNEHGHAA